MLMPTAPPVEVWMMTSVRARIASMNSLKRARDCVGVPSGSRAWRWITAAPASRQRRASSPISSAVSGRFGFWARVVSAPTMAAVRITGARAPDLARLEAHLARGGAEREDLALDLERVAGEDRGEELDGVVGAEETLVAVGADEELG